MKKYLIILLLSPLYLFAQEDYTNKKTALVIGNSAYPNAPLRNPKNDAVAMTATLEELGFEVLSYIDISRSEMRQAIQDFGDLISEKKGLGLFYYAGHGLQYQGKNFLVPVDAKIERSYQIEDECIRADQVLKMMELYGNPMNIIIMDACRNNPYTRSFRDMTQGLAKPDNAPVGSLVAFATAPGSVASDGEGDNGLYTQELIKAMKIPGLSIEQMFKQVRNRVLDITNNEQTPWENSSLRGEFYFAKPKSAPISIATDGIRSSFLYFNCGNRLYFQPPPNLETEYNPEFKVSGAEIIQESRPGVVTLIPYASSVELTVSNQNTDSIIFNFQVKRVPLPKIEISSAGKPIELKNGIKFTGSNTISLKVVPDKTFKRLVPPDANYRVSEWKIYLMRGSEQIKVEIIRGKQSVMLNEFKQFAKPNDRLVIEVIKVQRINFQNKIEPVVQFPITQFTVPLN